MGLFCVQIMFLKSATQKNGLARPPACVSRCISCATGELTVLMERMKPTPQPGAIAVRFNVNHVEMHFRTDTEF